MSISLVQAEDKTSLTWPQALKIWQTDITQGYTYTALVYACTCLYKMRANIQTGPFAYMRLLNYLNRCGALSKDKIPENCCHSQQQFILNRGFKWDICILAPQVTVKQLAVKSGGKINVPKLLDSLVVTIFQKMINTYHWSELIYINLFCPF